MYDLRDREFLAKLNSATKYPAIPTYHSMDLKSGLLQEDETIDFTGHRVQVSEKIDGTNGRIVVLPPTGGFVQDWVIGSREDLLTCDDDVMINPNLGIVDALRETAEKISTFHFDQGIPEIRVYFFEVYGGTVGSNSRQYTTDKELFGHRLFDVIEFSPELFDVTMSYGRESIAGWRARGNQPFMEWDNFLRTTQEINLERVPILTPRMDGLLLPRTFGEAVKFLEDWFPTGSGCRLDGNAVGLPEGVVLKSLDRKLTAKMRFQDYSSTIRRRREAMDKVARQRLRDAVVE